MKRKEEISAIINKNAEPFFAYFKSTLQSQMEELLVNRQNFDPLINTVYALHTLLQRYIYNVVKRETDLLAADPKDNNDAIDAFYEGEVLMRLAACTLDELHQQHSFAELYLPNISYRNIDTLLLTYADTSIPTGFYLEFQFEYEENCFDSVSVYVDRPVFIGALIDAVMPHFEQVEGLKTEEMYEAVFNNLSIHALDEGDIAESKRINEEEVFVPVSTLLDDTAVA